MSAPPRRSAGAGAAASDGGAAGPAPAAVGAVDDLVRLDDVTVLYPGRHSLLGRRHEGVLAVDGVSLAARAGRTLGLVGATGSGKSTVARVVMGMIAPTSGSVTVAGHDLSRVRGRERLELQRLRQVVLQDPYSSLDPRMRIDDIVAEPLTLGRHLRGRAARARTAERVAELLRVVGLPPSRAHHYPHQFSGGQRQRISIARALAPDPRLIVLDEPTSALDVSVRAQILNLLKDLQDRLGVTYLIISHDLTTVGYLSSAVAVMHRGRIVEIGPTEALYSSPRHPYTAKLLTSVPSPSGSFLRQPPPAPEPSDPLPATACHYAARCTLRELLGRPARCVEEDPVVTGPGQQHRAACHFPDEVARLAPVDVHATTPTQLPVPDGKEAL